MSNYMRSTIFVVSLLVFLLFFILINIIFPPRMISDSSNISMLVSLLYVAGYILALSSQALMKYLYTRNHMKGLDIIKILPSKSFEIRDRLILFALPGIAVILPMAEKSEATVETLLLLAYLVVLAPLLEVLALISSRTLKAYVTDKGFAINGLDFRLELSMPFRYPNAVGWYPFNRIENYIAFDNKILLNLSYDMGVIALECSGEEFRQIKELLVSNNIPEESN